MGEQPVERITVAGCPVDRIDRDAVVDELIDTVDAGGQTEVLGINAAVVVATHQDPDYKALVETMPVLVVDGFWVTMAARVLGLGDVPTVGIERIVYELMPRLGETGGTVFLLGTKEEIVRQAAVNVERRWPAVKVVGVRNGYFDEDDEPEILAEINAANPDVVLVGITSPKKEQWMARNRSAISARVTIGVGGVLDILGGVVPSAPIWIKEIGMEWLFRLWQDPRRLLKRYTVGNATFIWLVAVDFVRGLRRRWRAGR